MNESGGGPILVWFWSGGGGGSQFAVHLAHQLKHSFGNEQVALSMRADDPTIARAKALGLRVLPAAIISDRKRPWDSLANLGRSGQVLEQHIAASQAQTVCVAMNFAVAAPLGLMVKQKLVYCAHDPSPHPGDYEAAMQTVTQAALFQRAEAIAALSAYSMGSLAKMGFGAKVQTAPLNSVFAPHPQSLRTGSGPIRFVMIGRMIAYKGLNLLAEALTRIADRDDWRLIVAGPGPALNNIMRERLRLSQVERVSGEWMSEQETDALVAQSDVVLTPYRSASQSGVVAQALAAGRPVVATPIGALPEQIGYGRAGWLAKAATPEAYAAVLLEVLDNPASIATKAAGAREISEAAWNGRHWDWLLATQS